MLKSGDIVKIKIPAGDATGNTVRKFNGETTYISRVSGWTNGQIYYELQGVKSDAGIPYAFVESWLQKVEA